MIPSKESVSVQVFDLSNFVDNVLDYQVYNGYEELEFDFGEKALETAFIFKEGSRCAYYSIQTLGDSDELYKWMLSKINIQFKWIESKKIND